jgi:hypothetical protein
MRDKNCKTYNTNNTNQPVFSSVADTGFFREGGGRAQADKLASEASLINARV